MRARAIVGFAQCSASAEPLIKDTIRQIVTPRAMNRPPISRVVPTPEAQRTAPAVQEQGIVLGPIHSEHFRLRLLHP